MRLPSQDSPLDPTLLQTSGILQEANRLFFHPIGLALALEEGRPEGRGLSFNPRPCRLVVLKTDDPDGFIFESFSPIDLQRAKEFENMREARQKARSAALGFIVQPLPRKALLTRESVEDLLRLLIQILQPEAQRRVNVIAGGDFSWGSLWLESIWKEGVLQQRIMVRKPFVSGNPHYAAPFLEFYDSLAGHDSAQKEVVEGLEKLVETYQYWGTKGAFPCPDSI